MIESALLTAVAAATMAAVSPAPSDDFNDNLRGPAWSLIQDDPALSLAETNGQLQVTSTPPGSSINDAIYLSNGPHGFRLATDTDFSASIRFAVDPSRITPADPATPSTADLGLVFGVGTDATGFDAAAVSLGLSNTAVLDSTGAAVITRTNDNQSIRDTSLIALGIADVQGIMTLNYQSDIDRLTLALLLDGVSAPAVWFDLDGVVQGTEPTGWDADSLLVSFGVRGNDFDVQPGGLILDDFVLTSGRVVAIPEPGLAMLLGPMVIGLLGRRRRHG